jgi:PAS domain S-box-containing protein
VTLPSDELRHLMALLDRSVDGAVLVDRDLNIQYCNDAYAKLVGQRRRTLEREKPPCHASLELEICEADCAVKRARELKRGIRVDEIRAFAPDEPRTVIVSATPLYDAQGEYLGAIETYRDVTAEARTQQGYKVLLERARTEQDRLEAEVLSRTEALRAAQAQLVHQEKMSSLGRLVAGVTHELNNPLHFVSGNMEFLQRYATDLLAIVEDVAAGRNEEANRKLGALELAYVSKDLPKLVRSVREGVRRAVHIVANLRSFSHFGHGDSAATDLEACMRSTLEILEPSVRGRVEIQCDMAGLPHVVCNASHVNQVFLNLLSNAADAISGKGRIDVTGRVDGDYVEIRVTDSGAGIPPELMDRLFEPFFTTKPVGQGTGLGLSISFGIVRDHGGTISASSEPGRGSTFTVRLPIAGKPTAARA